MTMNTVTAAEILERPASTRYTAAAIAAVSKEMLESVRTSGPALIDVTLTLQLVTRLAECVVRCFDEAQGAGALAYDVATRG